MKLAANLTVFVTLTGAVIVLIAGTKPIPDRALRLAVDVGGILFSGAFWIATSIFLYRWHYFFRRAKELESELKGFKLYSGMKEGKWPAALRPGSLAWHVLHLAAMVFWLWRSYTDFSA
jgi:hypothetical protein